VSWRPSWSPFPNEGANGLFYEILTEFGLENAHLTNVVKRRGHKHEADPDNLALHEEIFQRELEILDARHGVVSMGQEAHGPVAELVLNRGAKPLARIPQYASMNHGPDKIAAFRMAIHDLAAIARRKGWIP
jgi:hypothetical protein